MTTTHRPVMLREVLEALEPRPGGWYVDATAGGGGHTEAILQANAPNGRVLALDRDAAAVDRVCHRLRDYGERVTVEQRDFRSLGESAVAHGFVPCDGVLLDLGLSSDQLAAPDRGFSFQTDAPLDMRFDRSTGPTAADLLNRASEAELADIFFHYGEERRARRLARFVVARRSREPFVRTTDLIEVVHQALGGRRSRLHPATRVFQALRVAVNDELAALREALAATAAILAEGGRLAVISFHSLEDRMVKQFIAAHAPGGDEPTLHALVRKPQTPRPDEVLENPRSRSAKLRIAQRVAGSTQNLGG